MCWDLKKQLNGARSINEGLQQQLKSQRERVSSKQSELRNFQAEHDAAMRRQAKLQSGDLLMRLYENPAEQLQLFHADLINAVKNYAETHHTGLNWHTRASLLTLTGRANFIIYNDNVEGETDKEKQRTRFYQLSGLLRQESEFVNDDQSYRNILLNLFNNRSVEQNDVLRKFDLLAANFKQQFRNMTEAEVLHHDVIEYKGAKQAFDNLLALGPRQHDRQWRNFYGSGKRISTCIYEEQTRTRKPHEPEFDVHLHTRIFQLASVILEHPDDVLARSELQALTQANKIGQPSSARKVFGAILAFIGSAAALVGGLALACGIPVISLPIAGSLIAAGSLGVMSGIFTFFSGCQRGLSKAYNKFDTLAVEIGGEMRSEPVRDVDIGPREYYAPSAPSLDIL